MDPCTAAASVSAAVVVFAVLAVAVSSPLGAPNYNSRLDFAKLLIEMEVLPGVDHCGGGTCPQGHASVHGLTQTPGTRGCRFGGWITCILQYGCDELSFSRFPEFLAAKLLWLDQN